MSMFKYTVYSKEERNRSKFNLLPQGDYYFEILNASNEISKTSGNPMIKLVLAVKKDKFSDNYHQLFDFIVDHPAISWKIGNLFSSLGLEHQYDLGEIDVTTLPGKHGYVSIGIKKDNRNPDQEQNSILDYITEDSVMKKQMDKTKEQLSGAVKKDGDEFDDEIPF